MTQRLRQAVAWLIASTVVLSGLLLLYSSASQATPPTNPAMPDVSWAVLQTIVAFGLFDLALLAGLVFARLQARPAALSPKALLAAAAAAAGLSLVLLIALLGWPLTPAILLWTLVLVAGFAVLLALGMVWSARRSRAKPAAPASDPEAQADGVQNVPDPAAEAQAPAPTAEDTTLLSPLVNLLGGDREAAERLVAMEQTLDPNASYRECVARAVYKVVRDRA